MTKAQTTHNPQMTRNQPAFDVDWIEDAEIIPYPDNGEIAKKRAWTPASINTKWPAVNGSWRTFHFLMSALCQIALIILPYLTVCTVGYLLYLGLSALIAWTAFWKAVGVLITAIVLGYWTLGLYNDYRDMNRRTRKDEQEGHTSTDVYNEITIIRGHRGKVNLYNKINIDQ